MGASSTPDRRAVSLPESWRGVLPLRRRGFLCGLAAFLAATACAGTATGSGSRPFGGASNRVAFFDDGTGFAE